MKKYKVLLAEDIIEHRDVIIKELEKLKPLEFQIDECEFPDKSLSRLADSEKNKEYYDILFVDLDFREQSHKGGKRDSGFQIIKRAFDVCPISKICTYSGQFREFDLSDEHQELVKRGLLVYSFDKNKRDAGLGDWFTKGMEEVLAELKMEEYLFDIFNNHKSIKEKISSADISFQEKWEINSNLETIILLLQKRKVFKADLGLFKLILQLYHRCLELYITGDKDDETIIEESIKHQEKVFEFVADLVNKEHREFIDKKSFLRKIAAFSPTKIYRFGHILNWYRNGAVHPDKKFTPELATVIFANLTLSIYVLDNKEKIDYLRIESFINKEEFIKENKKGIKDLSELLSYIKS